MLLSLFTLSPASKASSFWDLSGRQSGFSKPPKRRREGAGGSPVPYPSALPRRPAHLAPQRGKAISTVLGPKLSGPRGVQWAPWLTSHSQRQSRAGDTVGPAARCLRVGPGGPTEGEEERYWVRGWGALGALRGVERLSSPRAYGQQTAGTDTRWGRGTRGRWHCQTRVAAVDIWRFVTVLSRPRVKGGFQGQGTPRGRGLRGEGGVPSGPEHGDPAATAREDKVAPSGAGI